jgi:hypothetical protein
MMKKTIFQRFISPPSFPSVGFCVDLMHPSFFEQTGVGTNAALA